jgi:hypothetical protein
MLSVALQLFCYLHKGPIISLLSLKVRISFTQCLFVFFRFLLEYFLHLHIFLFILDQGLSEGIDFVDHSLLFEFVDVASALSLIQILVFFSNIHQQSLNQ